jgi:hypothetical protein
MNPILEFVEVEPTISSLIDPLPGVCRARPRRRRRA